MRSVFRPAHFARYREIARVLADEGFDYLAVETGFGRFVPLYKRRHAGRPRASVQERARRVLERLGPTFVKIGQLLSTRPDLLPPEFIEELQKLQDQVAPVPFEEIRAVLEAEFEAPLGSLFAEFDPVPIAAASIGQVHAATLPDGSEVVVKVQRPGITEVMRADFEIIHAQAAFAERATLWARRYNLVDNAGELERVLSGELDYIREARSADRFGRDFEDYPGVRVPRVYWDRTTRRVITLERLHGIKLDDTHALRASGFEPAEVARKGTDAYFKQMFEDGFFHADPHPGNLVITPEGDLGFTDFGRMGTISPRMRLQFADLFLALLDRDEREVVDIMLEIGVAGRETNQPALDQAISRLYTRYFDTALGDLALAEIAHEVMRAVYETRLRVPSDFTLLITTFTTLEGVAAALDPEFRMMESIRPFAMRVAGQRYAPSNLGRNVFRTLRHINRLLMDLPESLNRLMRRAADGSLGVEVRPEGFDRIIEQLREMVNRVSFAIVIAGFVVGFSFILRGAELPVWFLWISGAMLMGAAGIGVWFFLSIFVSIWRSRR